MILIKNYGKRLIYIALIVSILFIACSLQTTFAANQTINETSTGGILGGIGNATAGDTVFLQPGTYNKTGNDTSITINKNITLQGNGSADSVKIDAQGLSRIFSIGNGYNVTFINITFLNAYFAGNGGAIYNNYANTTMTFINCTFTNNNATNGNSIYTNGGNVSVSGCTFTDNSNRGSTGSTYGVILLAGGNRNSTANISNCTFLNNTGNFGAAINVGSSYIVDIFNCNFTNTTSTDGTIYVTGNSIVDISGCTFTNNTATGWGGAALLLTGPAGGHLIVNVHNSTFTNNNGSSGGAVMVRSTTSTSAISANISSCTFINNTAPGNGGAIYLWARINGTANANISDCTFTNNTAVNGNGGAISVNSDSNGNGAANISGCTFINNTAVNKLGDTLAVTTGVNSTGNSNVNISNCVITNNNSSRYNDGIVVSNGVDSTGNSSLNLDNVTFIGVATSSSIVVSNSTLGKPTTIRGVAKGENGYILANTELNVIIDDVIYTVTTNSAGEWSLTYTPTKTGNIQIAVTSNANTTYSGFMNNVYKVINSSTNFNVAKIPTSITIDVPKNLKVGENTTIESKLTDKDGNPIANATVDFYVDGKKIGSAITDANGVAKLNHTFNKAGKPNITAKYAGDNTYEASNAVTRTTVSKIKTNLELKTDNETITATLTDEDGNPLVNKKITIRIKGKTFTGTTDANGQVIIKFPNANKFKVTAKFAGDGQYAPSSAVVPGESEPNKSTSTISASGKVTMKSTGIPIIAALLTLITSIGLLIVRKRE